MGSRASETEVTLAEFYDALDKFDWLYLFSEDRAKIGSARNLEKRLTRYATLSPEHRKLYEEMRNYYCAFENARPKKPERPKF